VIRVHSARRCVGFDLRGGATGAGLTGSGRFGVGLDNGVVVASRPRIDAYTGASATGAAPASVFPEIWRNPHRE